MNPFSSVTSELDSELYKCTLQVIMTGQFTCWSLATNNNAVCSRPWQHSMLVTLLDSMTEVMLGHVNSYDDLQSQLDFAHRMIVIEYLVILINELCCSPCWNLEVPTNAIIYEREMSNIYPPHPEVEYARSQLVAKLRQQYEEACCTREGTLSARKYENISGYRCIISLLC